MDGEKRVCLDDIRKSSSHCIVYSFGLAGDWSFEESMVKMGCHVFGYDPTIRLDKWRSEDIPNGMKIENIGLGPTTDGNYTLPHGALSGLEGNSNIYKYGSQLACAI